MTIDRQNGRPPQRPRRSSYRFTHPEESSRETRQSAAGTQGTSRSRLHGRERYDDDSDQRSYSNAPRRAYRGGSYDEYSARSNRNDGYDSDDFDDDFDGDVFDDENDYHHYDRNDGYDDDYDDDQDDYDSYEADDGYNHASNRSTASSAAHQAGNRRSAGTAAGRDGEPEGMETEPSGRGQRRQHAASVSHRRSRKPILRIVLIVVLLFAFAAVGSTLSKGIHWTVAVFGVDSRDGDLEKGTRSDVIMIADINQLTGSVKLCSVFRDTYLRIDRDGSYNKINAAYEQGGHKQAIQALEDNLDIKIDDYVTFNWAAVAAGINALGGVDLEISDAEFSYINGFITETVNSTGIGSTQLTHAGMNHLDGVQAVAYGRLRLMDTDFNRTARQRKVLSLALDKAKQASAGTLLSIAKGLLPQVSTSVGVTDLIPVVNTLGRYHIPENASSGFPFSRQTMKIGKMDTVVATTLSSNVTTLHEFLYGKKNFKPSKTVEEISQHIAEKTGLTEAGENAPEAGTGGGVARKNKATAAPKQTEASTAPAQESSTAESETETEEIPDEPIETDAFGEILPGEDGEIHDGDRPGNQEGAQEGTEFGPGSSNGSHSGSRPSETTSEERPRETSPNSDNGPAASETRSDTTAEGPGTGAASGTGNSGGPGSSDSSSGPGTAGPGVAPGAVQ